MFRPHKQSRKKRSNNFLSLERLSLDEKQVRVSYCYGKEAKDREWMDYQMFIARVSTHIPVKGQVTVRYYGLYANAHRGKVKKASLELSLAGW
jgi:hypothetical protein